MILCVCVSPTAHYLLSLSSFCRSEDSVIICITRSSLRDEGSAPQPQDAQDGNEFAPTAEAPYGNNYGWPGMPPAPTLSEKPGCVPRARLPA